MNPRERMIKKLKIELAIINCLLKMTDSTTRRNDLKERLEILKRMRVAVQADEPLE